MSYNHALDAPFCVGDRVIAIQGAHINKKGTVTRKEREDVFYAEDTLYFVTFEDDTKECKDAFSYWQLALAEEQ